MKVNVARVTPHDLFEIQTLFDELCQILKKKANIDLKDVFLNVDPGFDSEDFRKACEKEKIIPYAYSIYSELLSNSNQISF